MYMKHTRGGQDGIRRRERATRRRLRMAAGAPRIASVSPTRLVVKDEVEAEYRAVVYDSEGTEREIQTIVEFPDGARAMLLAAAWRGGRGILDAVREIGLGCLRRAGADRLLAAATGERVSLRASVDDVRRVVASPLARGEQ